MSYQQINLAALSAPTGVVVPSFDAILAARLAQFLIFYNQARAANPSLQAMDAQTLALVTDPANIHQRVDAFREVIVASSINDAIKSTFLAWAVGASLDAFGAGMGVPRAANEKDPIYQARLQLAWEALSIGGTYGRYTFNALSADPVNLAGVAVYGAEISPVPAGQVWIVCLGANATGLPIPATLDAVRAGTADRSLRPVNDRVIVKAANPVAWSVDATLILADGADPATVISAQSASLTAFAAARRAIGASVSSDNIAAVLGYNASGLVYDVVVRSPSAIVGGGAFDAPIFSGARVVSQGRSA